MSLVTNATISTGYTSHLSGIIKITATTTGYLDIFSQLFATSPSAITNDIGYVFLRKQ